MCNITSLSRSAREAAKKWFFARTIILWITLFLGLTSIFLYKAPSIHIKAEYIPKIELIIAVLALFSQIISVLCLFRGVYLHRLSREGLRRGLLLDSFGITTEPLDLAYLTNRFSKKLEEKAALFENNYYSSNKKYGLMRLVDNLKESAFFTGNLFRRAAWRALLKFVIPAVIVLLLSFILPFIRDIESFSISRALITIMVFFCASGSITECVNLFSASSKASEVDRRLEKVDISSDEAIIAAFADYYVATELAPIISTKLYKKNRERLEQQWHERNK